MSAKRKRWPTGGHVKQMPLYGGNIWLFTDRPKYNQACRYVNSDHGDNCPHSAGLMVQAVRNHKERIYLIGVFNRDLGTLLHEIAHVCLNAVEHVGFHPKDGNGEPFCYLLDNLFSHFRHHLRR